jgi:hypothetical protein
LTNLDHLPPQKVPGVTLTREGCRLQASDIGPATTQVVDTLLNHRPEDRLRTAGRLLGLAERFGPLRLEAASARAMRFDDASYTTIKRILQQGLDAEECPSLQSAPPAFTFVRSAAELVGHLLGDASWR